MQRTSTINSPLFVGVNRLELKGFSPYPSVPSHLRSDMNLKKLTQRETLVFNGREITKAEFEKAKAWYLDEIQKVDCCDCNICQQLNKVSVYKYQKCSARTRL